MKTSALDRALGRATAALAAISGRELQNLGVLDGAVMLGALPNTGSFTEVRCLLAGHLQAQLSLPWIQSGDMLEVFSVLAALWEHDQTCVTGEQLACAIQRLIASEIEPGGPYFTDSQSKVAGIAANAQIASFVRLVAQPLPNMRAFFADVIASRSFGDSEVAEPYLIRFLAQAQAHNSPKLAQYVQEHWRQKQWQTPVRAAVALNIVPHEACAPDTKRALAFLCEQQLDSGFWSGEEPIRPGLAGRNRNAHFVATALAVEALARHQLRPATHLPDLQRRHQTVAHAAGQMFGSHAEPLRTSALVLAQAVCNADKSFEITLLPQFFDHALEVPARLSGRQCTVLGLANVYGWIAYTIYDDFLDGEGEPASLPVANVAMRASLDCFRAALPARCGFRQYVAVAFARMDEANAWEIAHCRLKIQTGKVTILELPRYGNAAVLADRSFAHVLAPMAVLAQCPRGNVYKVAKIESAFRHYLIARQLNDDMHDWLKDMCAGQASYVVTAILRDMRIKPEEYDLDALLVVMQRRFRRTTMPTICRRILWHIATAHRDFAASQLLRTSNDIYLLLDNLELSVRCSLDKHAKGEALMAMRPSADADQTTT